MELLAKSPNLRYSRLCSSYYCFFFCQKHLSIQVSYTYKIQRRKILSYVFFAKKNAFPSVIALFISGKAGYCRGVPPRRADKAQAQLCARAPRMRASKLLRFLDAHHMTRLTVSSRVRPTCSIFTFFGDGPYRNGATYLIEILRWNRFSQKSKHLSSFHDANWNKKPMNARPYLQILTT